MTYTKQDWIDARAAVDAIEAEQTALIKPTETRYNAARDRLEEIEDDLGDCLGRCVACAKPIFEGEPYHHGSEEPQCKECAPTYQDMLNEPQFFISFQTDEPMTPQQAKEVVDRHLAKGGSLTDKMVSP